MLTIKKLQLFPTHYVNQVVTLDGWIKHNRDSKAVSFLVVVDGSTFKGLQVVCKSSLSNFAQLVKLLPGSAIKIKGVATKDPRSTEAIEIVAQEVKIVNATGGDYFLQAKKHSKEFLRTRSELRARSDLFHAIFKVRNSLTRAIHEFFQKREFMLLNSPILTQNDCEGAGEGFVVSDAFSPDKKAFFNTTAILSVSGQLHAEGFAQCFKKVYTFGPTFRADKSNTKVHTSEFWMIEPEVAFATQKDGIKLVTDMIKGILASVYVESEAELTFLSSVYEVDLLKRIKSVVDCSFVSITYTEAVKILNQQERFASKPVVWGQDLGKEHETYLCQHFGYKPVFVTDYPKDLKAFYMKTNIHDPKTVACFDLLFWQIGEVVGGSERENDYTTLMENIKHKKISTESIEWYLNLRLQGYGGSTGFGLGFDRLLMYITGVENIRDVIPFFSGYKNLKF